ncbi:ABC transporter ATP-binding protein [Clostridium sp. E02]|uniref:ABC transporter ATP-binding protein n=1 Tax=Clostridium sp. E02 TaxID=2487134 RepID=UPI000F5446B8|nr:ABC transporter ATP-binding protein [Clostridium sp. E02]
MNKKKEEYSLLNVIFRIIPIQFKSAPWNCIIENILAVMNGLSFALTVVATQHLFDAISKAAMGDAGFMDCLIPLFILGTVTFGQQIINGVQNFHGTGILLPKSAGKLTELIHKKLGCIDPIYFEDTDFLDDLNKAKEGIRAITMFCMIVFVCVSFYGVYFLAIGIYLFQLKPMLILTLLLAFIPAMLAQTIHVKVFTKLEEQSAPLRREYEYYQKAICDREYFKETRILGVFQFFYNLFEETMKLLTDKIWKAERKTALLQLLLDFTTFVGMALTVYMLFTATMSGEITVGMFAAVFSALSQIFAIMQEIIKKHIGNMNRDIGKVINFIRLYDMPERSGKQATTDFRKGIYAKDISFKYPGREEPAIANVTLNIENGETIAIVGENGAGKSTLVRLLTGIYTPSSGKVFLGGVDTTLSSPASVYKNISGVFQKYQRYKMTLKENVAISNLSIETDQTRISFALSEADFEMGNIKLDDMVSPEFDGIDLSGGQWQRVAIARGLYRDNHFIVLDEPTSAIDPIEETKIYKQFKQLAEGKCAIVVTHRLGSAKLADRIVVMDRGQIVDIGTHDELISRHGKYAIMWEAQAQWYERSDIKNTATPVV